MGHWGSSVSIVTKLWAGLPGFDSQQGQGFSLYCHVQTGCEADHQTPSSAKVKNAWSYTSTPPMSSWCGT
jgi:hypothetical protein